MTTLLPDFARPARLARMLTGELVAESAHVQARWDAAVKSLRGLSADEQLRLLRAFAALAESYLGVVESARRLWVEVGQLGGVAEGADEIAAAGRVFDEMRREAGRAVEHRLNPWTPRDPARYEEGLRQAREGEAIPAEEVRDRFRRRAEGETR